MKLPPSGARPWSRIRVPNPDSWGGNILLKGVFNRDAPAPQTSSSGALSVVPSNSLVFSTRPANYNFALMSSSSSADTSLPDGAYMPSQGGSVTGYTNYYNVVENDSNQAGRVSNPPASSTTSLNWPDNVQENVNEAYPQAEIDEAGTAPIFEKGLITNAPYYTKLTNDPDSGGPSDGIQGQTWEYE